MENHGFVTVKKNLTPEKVNDSWSCSMCKGHGYHKCDACHGYGYTS